MRNLSIIVMAVAHLLTLVYLRWFTYVGHGLIAGRNPAQNRTNPAPCLLLLVPMLRQEYRLLSRVSLQFPRLELRYERVQEILPETTKAYRRHK